MVELHLLPLENTVDFLLELFELGGQEDALSLTVSVWFYNESNGWVLVALFLGHCAVG